MDLWQWKHRPRKVEKVYKDDEHFLIPRRYLHAALILLLVFIIVQKLIQRFLPILWRWLRHGNQQSINLGELVVFTVFTCFINMMILYHWIHNSHEFMMWMKGEEQILHGVYPRD